MSIKLTLFKWLFEKKCLGDFIDFKKTTSISENSKIAEFGQSKRAGDQLFRNSVVSNVAKQVDILGHWCPNL